MANRQTGGYSAFNRFNRYAAGVNGDNQLPFWKTPVVEEAIDVGQQAYTIDLEKSAMYVIDTAGDTDITFNVDALALIDRDGEVVSRSSTVVIKGTSIATITIHAPTTGTVTWNHLGGDFDGDTFDTSTHIGILAVTSYDDGSVFATFETAAIIP